MINLAKELLFMQYNQCIEVVGKDEFHTYFAEEKIRHSLQVAGAGNYLVEHVDWLKTKSAEYREMVKTACMLHDVCRFSQITKNFHGQKNYDHGVAAYEFLNHTALFDDIRIILPIKHHGHMIEKLYADEEYQRLDEGLRREVELICFLVRDADKIANFNMMTHEARYLPLFIDVDRELTDEDFKISEVVWKNAFVNDTIPRPCTTVAESMAAFISWYMDINYRAAIDYCSKLGVTDLMFKLFDKYCSDEEFKRKYSEHIYKHLNEYDFIK